MKTLLTRLTLFLLSVLLGGLAFGQHDFYNNYTFTRADTLRGSLRPERTCYDVTYYHLDIELQPANKSLSGYVDMHYQVMEDFNRLQIDLFENMHIASIEFGQDKLPFTREGNAVFVQFPRVQSKGQPGVLRINYSGTPIAAANPPWDGGLVWSKDDQGRNWCAVACEGTGASLWWPNKDHLSDEPDSMLISLTVPSELTAVANGNLRATTKDGDKTRYDWAVGYPINNYNVTLNVGHYAQFSDQYIAGDGDTLVLDYYVLDYNLAKARKHFQQVQSVLACYEHYLDKYPFWEDGFALVETPYLGMEHQGAIAYGNKYMRGYLGGMIPRDMNWDYIIVHETGHEYFGNSISCNDLCEMWIHESFTTYLEALYVEFTMTKADAVRYLNSQRGYILNKQPILGPMGVNWEDWTGSDHYYKGAWILHTLRHAIGDDAQWWAIFKGFYQKHAISNVTTQDFVDYVNTATGKDWTAFFDQYLQYPSIPVFEYEIEEKKNHLLLRYKWRAHTQGFNMPLMVGKKDAYTRIQPKPDVWQEIKLPDTSMEEFKIATELFLIKTEKK